MPKFVIGYLGPKAPKNERKRWNDLFNKRGIDAFFDCYPTKNRDDLQQRLSEMFLLERRGYVIDPALRGFLGGLLDQGPEKGSADTVVNDGGVLKGYAANTDDERLTLWFG